MRIAQWSSTSSGEPVRLLVVGGVGLEDQPRLVLQDGPQLHGPFAVVVDDLQMVEFHGGLHDERDDAWPDVGEADLLERVAVPVEGRAGSPGGGGRQGAEGFVCASRHRDFRADHVQDVARETGAGGGVLGDA
nr:hypothetical protein [Cryobacterium breve]